MANFKALSVIISAAMAASAISPVAQAFASTDSANSTSTLATIYTPNPNWYVGKDAPDDNSVSMQKVFANSGLTSEQQAALVKDIIYLNLHTKQARSRYYYLTQKMTAKQVKKAWNSANVVATITGFLNSAAGKAGAYASMAAIALYGNYYA